MRRCLEWVQTWDFMVIIYRIAAVLIISLLVKWAGLFRKAHLWIKRRRARKRYIQVLRDECNLLIVVGKRKGFSLPEVYVQLDIARSDLMPTKSEKEEDFPHTKERSFVLVGGPGAGKSTTVKKSILDAIGLGLEFPLFLRLRDYVGFDRFEAYVGHKLQAAGFPDHEQLARDVLNSDRCYCVLDGLDEVRPQVRSRVIADINAFYHKYFTNNKHLIVTCRKEAYRTIPLDIPTIMEVRPLTDEQIKRFADTWADTWPLGYPTGKSSTTFWRDLNTTPRILELTRSPLLLVGGLMQYTESNLGIPEERCEYLGRVARWLVVDWATAQGHPVDPYRSAYDRLLSRLAYHMHSKQCTELDRQIAEHLIGTWLPLFGLANIPPSEVLDSITTRTGILISEEKNFIVFAQFGLQEYFASLELVSTVGADGLAKMEPMQWWREAILLATAQQREPTQILESLFDQVPLIAAAAVAECPTPSVGMQERAANACITAIDKNDKEVSGALVPLLRKVRDRVELELCEQLEARLTSSDTRASIVGLCLATAGTDAATSTLAKHPDVWDLCLKEAGYLSSSVENLLVDWITKGTDIQSQRASDLIASRLSSDRLLQLLRILPSLASTRAERLATLILEHCGKALNFRALPEMEVPVPIAARCVPFISDRHKYMEAQSKSVSSKRRLRYLGRGEPVGVILTCLHLEDRHKHRFLEKRILSTINHCLQWSNAGGKYVLFGLAPLFMFLTNCDTILNYSISLALIAIACWTVTYPNSPLPWARYFSTTAYASVVINGTLVISGITATLAFIHPRIATYDHLVHSSLTIVFLILAFIVHAHAPWWSIRWRDFHGRLPDLEQDTKRSLLFRTIYPLLFGLTILATAILPLLIPLSGPTMLMVSRVLATVFTVWVAACIVVMSRSYMACRVASKKAEQEFEHIMEKSKG